MQRGLLAVALAAAMIVFLIPASPSVADTANLPIQIRNVYTMDSPQTVKSVTPFVPKPETLPPYKAISERGFNNQTITKGQYQLTIQSGVVNGTKVVFMDYSGTFSGNLVTIVDNLGQVGKGQYLSSLVANIMPVGTDLKVGDAFVLNYTSTLGDHLVGQADGLGIVGRQDIQSHNATISQLGLYYLTMSLAFLTMNHMLPTSIANLKVDRTLATVTDDNCVVNCYLVWVIVSVSVFGTICVIAFPAGCILAVVYVIFVLTYDIPTLVCDSVCN